MDVVQRAETEPTRELARLTSDWGEWKSVSLYLDRCQVDTPKPLVSSAWNHVREFRRSVGKVVDFGAGDGRFSTSGQFTEYIGYEIDPDRCATNLVAANARILNRCAFSEAISDADLCIGNPPFVRNQALPNGWRQRAASVLRQRTGVMISGLANAWQYFFLLSIASAKPDGLVVLVIPYEWVSRPSARSLRDYIVSKKWDVRVYRLVDTTFDSVLTTSSITIVDKRASTGRWEYFEESEGGGYQRLKSASGAATGVIGYLRRSEVSREGPRAKRGLSPGTQKVLVLTEGERVRSGLRIGTDVVPCVTTLRNLPPNLRTLSEAVFEKHYRLSGQRCWLIRTDKRPSVALRRYLDAVLPTDYQTTTCLEREEWWKFSMPAVPNALLAMSFRDAFPKIVRNAIEARAVGGVYGIYGVTVAQTRRLANGLDGLDIRDRIVAHSNGLRKIEVNQVNALLAEHFPTAARSKR